jgi:lipoprotein-anchoring transpeptidase ErfK/SrfK
VVGAWAWLDNQHVDFRPRDYWPAHTTITFTGLLNGVQAAPGVYGAADLTQTFQIGDSLIVTASTTSHHMQVYLNGKLQYDWPISTGAPGHDTPNGTYLTIDKGNPVEMKPADIAPGQPGYYDLMVPWAVRFTWNGIYLHDAYWSVGQQGSVNVSHGCVNMPPAAAQTYYQEELPGDPVTITGSPLAGTPGNGWTDWFDSWPQLLATSALHQAVETGPNGSTFVAPSAVAPDTTTAPLGTSAANNAAAG